MTRSVVVPFLENRTSSAWTNNRIDFFSAQRFYHVTRYATVFDFKAYANMSPETNNRISAYAVEHNNKLGVADNALDVRYETTTRITETKFVTPGVGTSTK